MESTGVHLTGWRVTAGIIRTTAGRTQGGVREPAGVDAARLNPTTIAAIDENMRFHRNRPLRDGGSVGDTHDRTGVGRARKMAGFMGAGGIQ